MKIQKAYVVNETVRGPLRVVVSQPVAAGASVAPEVSAVRSIFTGVTAGGTAKLAWQGFQVTDTLGANELTALLVKNGLAPEHAPTVAAQALDVIRAEPTKVILVAVSAGGTAWAALEAASNLFGMRLSAWRKFAISGAVAVAAGIAYYYLRSRGYLQ